MKIIIICWSVIVSTITSQGNIEKGFPQINNYLPKDYGADTQNWDILQDDRGIMYFGNNLGLLEFDGAEWRLYNMPNNSVVRSIALGENGEIFVGGVGDLGYYLSDSLGKLNFHSLYHYLPEKFRDFSDVWNTEITDNKVFFNTSNYTLIWDIVKKEFNIIASKNGFHGIYLVNDKIYVREWGVGLQVFENGKFILLKHGEKFANERVYVMLPFPEEEGVILIVTRTMGLFKFDGKQFNPFPTEADQFLKDNLIYLPGTILHDGNILLGTLNGGAVIIDGNGRLKHKYNISGGIKSQNILYNFQDYTGAIWLATDAGICRIDYSSHVSYFDTRNNYTTTAVDLIRNNGILYAAAFEGIYYLDPLTSNFNKIKNNQAFVFYDDGDELLVGSADGLYTISNTRISLIKKTIGNEYFVNSIIRSKVDTSRYYIGAAGLWSLNKKNNNWVDEGQLLDLEDVVHSIVEESDGVLWLGTNASGVFRITPKYDEKGDFILNEFKVQNFNDSSGLPDGIIYVKKINGENYFLSTQNFYRFDENTQTFYLDKTYKVVPPLSTYVNPRNIAEDNLNRLWVSMGREPALGTPQPDGSYQWLKAPFKRFSKELVQSIYPEDNGVVWFSSNSKIIKYDLTKAKFNNSNYSALVREVKINTDSSIYFGGKLSELSTPKITYENNSIKFIFAATSYEDQNAIQFKTKLDGFEKSWSTWINDNKKEYTNLPAGTYAFNVVAKNVFEIESKPATYSFEILSPWYRTWKAYFSYLLMFGVFIFLVDKLQRKRLLKKAKDRMQIQEVEHRAETAELQAKAAEAQSKIIQAENDRKTQELEEARQLQLSMLPKGLPSLPNLDISVYMKTATEVGGDYYDFQVDDDGSLIVALGDATGHGMQAGTLVTLIKGLFTSEASNKEILKFFNDASKTIKEINLGRLLMAFSLLKIKGNKLEFSSAGLPPMYIYRNGDRRVEEIDTQGMPLGAMKNFGYKLYESELNKGDCILLLSDGYPELANSKNEQLGYERLKSQFAENALRKPDEIIEYFKNFGSEWVAGNAPDDDITFVVIKVK